MTTRQTGLSAPGPAAAGHAGTATLVLAARTNPETARALADHENEIGEGCSTATALARRRRCS